MNIRSKSKDREHQQHDTIGMADSRTGEGPPTRGALLSIYAGTNGFHAAVTPFMLVADSVIARFSSFIISEWLGRQASPAGKALLDGYHEKQLHIVCHTR